MKHISGRQLVLLAGDCALATGGFYLGYLIRVGHPVHVAEVYTGATLASLSALLFSLYLFDLYNVREHYSDLHFVPRLLFSVVLFSLTAMAFFYFSGEWKFGRGAFVIGVVVLGPALGGWRVLYDRVLPFPTRDKRAVIVGAGSCGQTICEALKREHSGYRVVGFLDDDPALQGEKIAGRRVLGPTSEVARYYDSGVMDSVVVAITGDKSEQLLNAVLQSKMKGAHVYDMPTLYEILTGQVPVNHLRDAWLVYSDGYTLLRSRVLRSAKRLIDISVSVVGLIFSFPICIVTAVAIKLDSPGPVFFRQTRVGKDGEHFTLYKFRSMTDGAEAECGPKWADEGDERVTRVGRIIRKTRIDEIPQMWNVLKGQMSLVGPRPERPGFVEGLTEDLPYYGLRHAVRPGITGWAQVNYRYGASVEDALEKLKYDLHYVHHMNLFMDLHILLRTLRVMLLQFGGR